MITKDVAEPDERKIIWEPKSVNSTVNKHQAEELAVVFGSLEISRLDECISVVRDMMKCCEIVQPLTVFNMC